MHALRALRIRLPIINLLVDQARHKSYKLVVLGGGTGGCATAAKFSSKLGKGQVAIIEPADMHYYQPMFTLIGRGIKDLEQAGCPMNQVLPKGADWIKDKVTAFDPDNNKIVTNSGEEINYEFLVVAIGLQLNYALIKGFSDAINTKGVCSIYSPLYVKKTFEAMQKFEKGNAIFTFPNTPIKCAGAPQKIMYLTEEYLDLANNRANANIIFNTSLGVLFGVKKYADALWEIVKSRDIVVNLRTNLVEIKPDSREAVFELLDIPGKFVTYPYEMLHVTPPMSTPDVLRECKQLVDACGFLDVDRGTLQHIKYKNIFGIGDCTNLPTSRTGAAVAGQLGVLRKNLKAAIKGKPVSAEYDGYTSCPLVVGHSKCILAEFDYDLQPLETFPFNQGKAMRIMYYMKKDVMPAIYWTALLKGNWEGPKYMRKAFHFGFSK